MIRTANIEVSLQELPILRIEHPQANPLKLACRLRAGEALPSALTVTAEIHTSRNVAAETTPLASSTVTVAADATSFEVTFLSEQTNQTVTPDSTRPLWLVIYGVGDADLICTLATCDLLLGWHAISRVTPPPPATAALVEKGGVAWVTARQYAAGTMVTVGTTTYVASNAHTSGSTTQPGTGASWNTVWTILSGGGATNLSVTATATSFTIVSSSGDDALVPAATDTDAGAFPAALHTKLTALPTAAALTTSLSGKADLVGGKLNTSQLPDLAVTQYLGTAANQAAMLLLVGQSGDWCVRSDDGKVYVVTGEPSSTLSNWTSLSYPTAPVLSVAGRTGSITLSSGDISGLGALATLASVGTSQIDNSAVTYVKMQPVSAASRLIGRGTAGGTAVREISLGAGLTISGDVLSATATGGGTNTIIQKFPEDASFPTTNFATRDSRGDHPVLDFDSSTPETAYFKAFIPQGASFAPSGTALTFVIESSATSATTGNVGWGISLERLVANGIDIDSPAFGTEQTGSAAVNAQSGKSSEVTITFTLAQLPSGLAAGDMIRICLKRNTAVGSNHSGDAEFLGLYANMTPIIA